jgi:hypothetical protein
MLLNQYEEQLEECRKYKEFLDNLTPAAWLAKVQQDRAQKQQEALRLAAARVIFSSLIGKLKSNEYYRPKYCHKNGYLVIKICLSHHKYEMKGRAQKQQEALRLATARVILFRLLFYFETRYCRT